MVSSTLPATIVAEFAGLICTLAAFTLLTISHAPKRNKLVNLLFILFLLESKCFQITLYIKFNSIHGRSV